MLLNLILAHSYTLESTPTADWMVPNSRRDPCVAARSLDREDRVRGRVCISLTAEGMTADQERAKTRRRVISPRSASCKAVRYSKRSDGVSMSSPAPHVNRGRPSDRAR